MSDPYTGEIMMAGFSFAPADYAFCHGQIMAVSQYSALHSLIGTSFGGDGQTDFALPDLRGRAPRHIGSGVAVGTIDGAETVTLGLNNTGHSHAFWGSEREGVTHLPFNATSLEGNVLAGISDMESPAYYSALNPFLWAIGTTSIETVGDGQPHDNMQPYLVITFCIAMHGLYPSRN